MSRSTRLTLMALLLTSAACQPAPKTETTSMAGESAAPAGLSAEDEAAIRAIDGQWAKAATAGDANALAALYAPDATLLPPDEPPVKAGVKSYFEAMTAGFTGPFELTTASVEGRGDLAFVTGTYKATMTPRKAGAKQLPTEEGKYLEVLKKQPDGSWKLVYDIWNRNAAPKQ